jgi:hypothetical protein
MNRSTEPDFDQRIADWLEDDPNLAPRQALETVLAAYPSIPQRRPMWVPRRFPTMTMPIRLAAAAVIGVLAVGGAFYLSQPSKPSVGPPAPTPSASVSPAASGSALPAAGAFTRTGAPSIDHDVRGITVALADGRVLIAGGGDGALTTAEIYDPATGVWKATGSMQDERSYPVAARLVDGRVLIAGGTDSRGNNLRTAELFDPTTGAWTRTGQMAFVRNQAFAALLPTGKVLVGGAGSDLGNDTSAELFDPATGRWTVTGDMTRGRAGPLSATVLSDGRLLVTGGFTSDQRSAEIYDPAAGTWAATGQLGSVRVDEQTGALLPDGRVLSIGGRPTTGEVFDPAAGTWSSTGPIGASYLDLLVSVRLPDGRVFMAGGGPAAAAHIFDPSTNAWSSAGPIAKARFVRSASLLADGRVLVVTYDDTDTPGAVIYTPSAGS